MELILPELPLSIFVMTYECKQTFFSVVHPPKNGQAELANKVILKGIKKKLDDAKGLWIEQLHEVL